MRTDFDAQGHLNNAATVRIFNDIRGSYVRDEVGPGFLAMILLFVILSLFIAGLMVGRTPSFLGKKIEAKEVKLVVLAIFASPLIILLTTALAASTKAGTAGPLNAGPHGFSEILYAFTSAAGNNGSAFGGLTANTVFYCYALAVAMMIGRSELESRCRTRPSTSNPLIPGIITSSSTR